MHKARVHWLQSPSRFVLVLVSLSLTSCASSTSAILGLQAAFPPQKAIDSGNFRNFLTENENNLSTCGTWTGCDVTLFNLGFVYAYPRSPYRDAQKARQYLHELRRKFPRSPWAAQGRVLLTFIDEQGGLEEARRRLQSDLRTRDTTIRKLQGQLDRSREIDIEIEKKERELLR
jgi:hypothetical protein